MGITEAATQLNLAKGVDMQGPDPPPDHHHQRRYPQPDAILQMVTKQADNRQQQQCHHHQGQLTLKTPWQHVITGKASLTVDLIANRQKQHHQPVQQPDPRHAATNGLPARLSQMIRQG